mmetsp:Transcript_15181/g.35797  ORF Transcript_15181/g.35797 Transcript_15181/m.35797 type:complete len:230 (-) Transcript_15181:61-750(-)
MCHLRQRDVGGIETQRQVVQVHMLPCSQQHLHFFLDVSGLAEILRIQRHPLLRLETFEVRLQLSIQVLVLKELWEAVCLVNLAVALAQHAVNLVADFRDACLAKRVPILLRHEVRIYTQIAQEGLRPQVSVDLHALVDVIEELRGVLSRPSEDRRGATGMTIHELREIIDLAVESHPAILGGAVAVHLGERDVLGDGRGAGLVNDFLLELRDARRVLVAGVLGGHDRGR